MHVTPVSEGEFDTTLEIWQRSVQATHQFVDPSDLEMFRPMVRNRFETIEHLAGLRDQAEQLIGFAGAAESKLEMLFLDPVAIGQGGGRLLVQHAIDEFGIREVDVNEQNGAAVGFYLHFGFVVSSRSPVDDFGKPYPILRLVLP